MNKEILKNWHKYHVPGQSHHTTRPRNAIFISAANSIKHELTKCIVAIQIQRYGDVFIDNTMRRAIEDLVSTIELQKGVENPCIFLTEAVPNDRPKRRVDVVNINTLDEFEVETDHKIKKPGAITIPI